MFKRLFLGLGLSLTPAFALAEAPSAVVTQAPAAPDLVDIGHPPARGKAAAPAKAQIDHQELRGQLREIRQERGSQPSDESREREAAERREMRTERREALRERRRGR